MSYLWSWTRRYIVCSYHLQLHWTGDANVSILSAAWGWESGHSGGHKCLCSAAERWDCDLHPWDTVTNTYVVTVCRLYKVSFLVSFPDSMRMRLVSFAYHKAVGSGPVGAIGQRGVPISAVYCACGAAAERRTAATSKLVKFQTQGWSRDSKASNDRWSSSPCLWMLTILQRKWKPTMTILIVCNCHTHFCTCV